MRMRWLLLFVLVATMVGSVGVGAQAQAAPGVTSPGATSTGCEEGDNLPGGASWKICIPLNWNGDLVLWAHGYVAPEDELTFQDEVPGDTPISLPDLVQSLGYAFAATTYRENGLVVIDGQKDVLALLDEFKDQYSATNGGQEFGGNVFLTGASMGGLIVTLLAEDRANADKFTGALAACGIVGDFRRHINYWGDFRVLFDYFYPGVLPVYDPESPEAYPQSTQAWAPYATEIQKAVQNGDDRLWQQLIAVSKAPVAAPTEDAALATIQSVLFYSVISAPDAAIRLRGNPFDNQWRWYWGSANDLKLNLKVDRLKADWQALIEMRNYQTSGKARIPLVMPHTTDDEVVRFEQTLLYWLKARPVGAGKVTPIPVSGFGHCRFTEEQVLLSFALMVFQSTGQLPAPLASRIASLELTSPEAGLAGQLQAFGASAEAELATQLAIYEQATAEDAAAQAQAIWPRAFLPLVVR